MPFGDITTLAMTNAAEDERKRREAQAALEQAAADLKRQADEAHIEDASGPAGLLAHLMKSSKNTAVAGDVQRNAEQDQFLNDQRDEQFRRRGADLGRRAEHLAVAGPSTAERAAQMSAPLGRFAEEDAASRAQELRTNPRGRLADVDALMATLQGGGDVSRETPIYTDAPRARPRDDQGTMPYAGALDELLGVEVPRAGIRKEFGGTAPDTTLSFSDRREPGMRPYNSSSGTTKDVGAPGGGLISARGEPDTTVLDAQRASLQELRSEAERAPFSPQERAADLVTQEPGWDTIAAEQGPFTIGQVLNEAVGQGRLNPATGQYLQRKYASVADDIDQGDGPDPKEFARRLRQGRPPAPGEAEALARSGGQAIPQAQAAEQQATQQALQSPEDAPGTTRSPALAERSPDPRDKLLGELRQPRGQSYDVPGGIGGELGYELNAPFIPKGMGQGPAVPPWMSDLPENIRLVLEGATRAAGGHEHSAERARRLAREAARRGQ